MTKRGSDDAETSPTKKPRDDETPDSGDDNVMRFFAVAPLGMCMQTLRQEGGGSMLCDVMLSESITEQRKQAILEKCGDEARSHLWTYAVKAKHAQLQSALASLGSMRAIDLCLLVDTQQQFTSANGLCKHLNLLGAQIRARPASVDHVYVATVAVALIRKCCVADLGELLSAILRVSECSAEELLLAPLSPDGLRFVDSILNCMAAPSEDALLPLVRWLCTVAPSRTWLRVAYGEDAAAFTRLKAIACPGTLSLLLDTFEFRKTWCAALWDAKMGLNTSDWITRSYEIPRKLSAAMELHALEDCLLANNKKQQPVTDEAPAP